TPAQSACGSRLPLRTASLAAFTGAAKCRPSATQSSTRTPGIQWNLPSCSCPTFLVCPNFVTMRDENTIFLPRANTTTSANGGPLGMSSATTRTFRSKTPNTFFLITTILCNLLAVADWSRDAGKCFSCSS
ncbi:unnamed protein product, partial [Ixodes pacificus]